MSDLSRAEQILRALFALIDAARPIGATLERNETLPARIPPQGHAILRDGDPGEPEILMSPLTFIYEHMAELDIIAAGPADEREAAFDAYKRAVGAALAADQTLGGLCDYVEARAPAPVEIPLEGAEDLKAATIGIVLTYAASAPLT